MNGKIIAIGLAVIAIVAGGWMYYLQVYHYYERVSSEGVAVTLVSRETGAPVEIEINDLEAIDAESSPIRYRGCFVTSLSLVGLLERYEIREDAVPLTAPGWFECFDATEIGDALAGGTALAFTGQENIEYGVDRIVAILADGRGFIWHQLNNCGQRAYDGSPVGAECPPRESN